MVIVNEIQTKNLSIILLPQIDIDVNGGENPHSPKFRDFLNLFAEKRKRISANKFPDSRKNSRLFAEINSRISANIFWMPRLTRVLAWRILRSLSQIQKKSWNSSHFPCAKTLFVVYLSWKVR